MGIRAVGQRAVCCPSGSIKYLRATVKTIFSVVENICLILDGSSQFNLSCSSVAHASDTQPCSRPRESLKGRSNLGLRGAEIKKSKTNLPLRNRPLRGILH